MSLLEIIWVLGLLGIIGAIFAPKRIKTRIAGIFTLLGSIITLTFYGSNIQTINVDLGVFSIIFSENVSSWPFVAMIAFPYLGLGFYLLSKREENEKVAIVPATFAVMVSIPFANNLVTIFILWELITWLSFVYVLKSGPRGSIKYFTMNVAGAYLMLFGITRAYGYGITDLSALGKLDVALLFIIAAIVKLGSFPFHIWVPEAYGKSESYYVSVFSGSIDKMAIYVLTYASIMAGYSVIVGALGVYSNDFGYILAWLGGLSIIIGTFMAIVQEDAQKLLAYSSIAQIGYALLAIGVGGSLGYMGALLQAFAHALFETTMFLFIDAIYKRTGSTMFYDLGGLFSEMPFTMFMVLAAALSMAGIPMFIGFNAKWFIYEAVIIKRYPFMTAFLFIGSAGGFMYVMRFLYGIFFGIKHKKNEGIGGLDPFEFIGITVPAIISMLFGVVPGLLIRAFNPVLEAMGLEPINASLFSITHSVGYLAPMYIVSGMIIGFIIIYAILLITSKPRYVGVYENYSSAQPIGEGISMNIWQDFYRPIKDDFKSFYKPFIENSWESLAKFFETLGNVFKEAIFNDNTEAYLWYASLAFI
ncbi:MAG TPA: hypothetical protein ENI59_01340, partial [Euryarchaeota archaeon]|nr:hypothetical protein [Euryarchaeota archaeon]